MYDLVRLDVNSLDDRLRACYESLTPVSLHCCLHGKDPEGLKGTILAFGVTWQGNPVGIAFASYIPSLKHVYIHHLFVHPEHRNKHLGRQLLSQVKEAGKNAGGTFFSFIYPLDEPTTPAVEKVVAATGWKGTRPYLLRCLYDAYTFDMPWVHIDYRYPDGFEEFRWIELTPEEREGLRRRYIQHAFPIAVSPFLDEDRLEPLNSLGLRYQERIVGWMLTHRIDPDTIRYSSLCVEQSLHFKGVAMKLLFDAIRLHLAAKTHWAILEIPLIQVSSSWKHFAEKRLVPYADKITRLVQAWDITSQ